MTVLAANRETDRKVGDVMDYEMVASDIIYKGSGVCANAAGYALPAADTSGLITIGVAVEKKDNSSGSAGDETVLVWRRGVFEFTTSGLTIANIGDDVYWVDDNIVNLVGVTTNDIIAGRIAGFISATSIWVDISKAIEA